MQAFEFSGRGSKLSNFYPSKVIYEGLTYQSGEAAFQAAKTLNQNDRLEFTKLNPSKAKQKGRQVRLRPDWEQIKFDVMVEVLRSKFSAPEFKEVLIGTKGQEIIEVTTGWHDNIWGDCRCPRCNHFKGQNWLGKALMKVRDEILEGIL